MVKVAILGYGVVGSGVAEVLSNHLEALQSAPKKRSASNIFWIFGIFRIVLSLTGLRSRLTRL